jgi:hypothetical protein
MKVDRFEITGMRMTAGEAVGEGYLYGSDAVELWARGLVDVDTMKKYRSAAFFKRKDLYGHDAAIAWEESAKQRHEEAKVVFKAGKQA